MAVGGEDDQIRLSVAGVLNDLFPRAPRVANGGVHFEAAGGETGGNAVQILAAGADFGGGGEWAVELAGDILFDVQQVERCAVDAGESGGVSDGLAIVRRMIEQDENAVVARGGKNGGDGFGHQRRRTAATPGGGEPLVERDAEEEDGESEEREEQTEFDPEASGAQIGEPSGDGGIGEGDV